MKICILTQNYYKFTNGGAEIQCKYIADHLSSREHDIYYIFLHQENIRFREDNINLFGIKKKRQLNKIFGEIVYFRRVLYLLKKIAPDFIYHRNLSNFSLPVINYCRKHECKSILHIAHKRDVEKNITGSKNIVSNLIGYYGKTKILKNFSFIIAQAKYQDKLLKKNYNRPADLIFPNIHPKPIGKIEKKKSIKKVVWVANLKKWKQPEKFIELAKSYQDSKIEYIMIGRDLQNEWSSNLKRKIKKLSNLEYPGELSIYKINRILAESHIFVNTSLAEGFPNTFIQALMRKVPVVSLNVDPDNILKRYNIGFHSRNFSQMVKDVKKLVENNELRENMGEKAQRYAYRKHTFNNMESLVDLIEK